MSGDRDRIEFVTGDGFSAMRYAACVEYDGAAFSGWQSQKHAVRTVQQTVEAALSRVANQAIQVITAGRTDAGVHATHQIIHFDSDAERTPFAWCRGSNRFLDHDVRLSWVVPVADDFHARFSATARSYRFVIHNAPVRSALYRHHATHEYRKLEPDRMREAGQALLGEHDFSSFRAAGCQAQSALRDLRKFALNSDGDWIWFDVTANAFLQHMVRNIAGCLIEVGCAKRDVSWVADVLAKRDRTQGGITAPPNGLYLVGVDYQTPEPLPSSYKAVAYWGR